MRNVAPLKKLALIALVQNSRTKWRAAFFSVEWRSEVTACVVAASEHAAVVVAVLSLNHHLYIVSYYIV